VKALQHSPADIVRWAMVAMGLGTNPLASNYQGADWPISAESELPSPDNAIVTYTTMPQLDGRSMNNGDQATHWAFQIRVRGRTKEKDAELKAEAIKNALNNNVNQMKLTIANLVGGGSTVYVIACFAKVSGPTAVGTEAPHSKRHIYTLNGFFTVRAL
jgi:hypothetical protein